MELKACKKIEQTCELSVYEQVKNACDTTIVKNAWKLGQELSVHGWMYSVKKGILQDMKTSVASISDYNEQFSD
ncbi:MAG: hypothetical protein D6B28_06290 [Gammaproteobacteria bacterium]|nr:MAG: hypothetical protein D6B28_06290 [Gammaproteobacteria bacterium]